MAKIGKKYQNDVPEQSPYSLYRSYLQGFEWKIPKLNNTTPQITKIKLKAKVTWWMESTFSFVIAG